MTSAMALRDASAWEGFLELDGSRVHAVSWGGRPRRGIATGRQVLLLHGLGGTTIHWELVGAGLADRLGAMVTAIDLRGFGRTRSRPESSTVAANAQLVTLYLEQYGNAELVGNSMGGAIAMMVAAERPELVSRLVLVAGVLPQPPWPEPPLPILPHNWPAAVPGLGVLAVKAYAAATTDDRIVDERLRRSFFEIRRVDPVIRLRMIELARERREFQEAAYVYAAATRSLFWYATSPDGSSRDLERVECPTLIIHGEEDRLVPVDLARSAHRRRPEWRLDVLCGCGHLPQLELPGAFVEAADGRR